MAQVDGSLNFDTSIDSSGFSKGINKLSSAATKGLAAAGTALVGVSGYALKVGSDFEAAMSRVAGISGATGKDLERLEETAKELGSTTKFSATEAAEAMENLASAGFTTNEIIDATPGLMDLAAAAGEDLASSADIAASTLRGFGLEASEAGHVADVLAENANRTNAAVADTGEAMKYVAPVAKAMGISMEETAAAIGLLSNAGIKGSQAGTTLRGALTRLVKPTEDMEGVMEELGITFFDNEGKMKSLTEIIEILQDSTKDLTDEQKNNALATLFGQEALSGMLALINEGPDALDELTTAYENCDGAASETAKTMNDNLKGSLDELESAMEGAGITAYKKFEKPIRKAVQGATEEISDLDKAMSSGKLSDSMDTVAEGLGAVAETALGLATDAIPVLIDGFAFVVDNANTLIPVITGVGAAWVYMANQQKIANTIAIATTTVQKGLAAGSLALETATSLLTGKITLQTAAQEALNLVQMASPQGMLTAAVVGATAAVGALVVMMASQTEETDKNTIATQELVDEYEELNNTLADNKAAREEAVDNAAAEAKSAEILMDKLEQLSKKENKSNAEKKVMASYVEELNELLPDLNLRYDEEKDALNRSTEAIRSNIESQKQLALAKAYQDNMAEIINDIADAEMERDEATQQHVKNEQALAEATKARIDAYEELQEAGENATNAQKMAYSEAANAEAKAQENCNASAETVKKLEKNISELNAEYEKTEGYVERAFNSADIEKQLTKITEMAREKGLQVGPEIAEGIRAGKYAVPQSIEELQALVNFAKIEEKAGDSGIKVPQYIADGISDGSMKPADAVKEMNSYVKFADLLQKTSEAGYSVPEELSKQVQEGSMKPADAVKQMNNLVSFNDLLEKSDNAGYKVPDTLQKKILEGKMKPSDAVQVVEDLIEFEDLLEKSDQAGKDVPDEIYNGIIEGKLDPQRAVKQMNEYTKNELDKMGPSAKQSGKNMTGDYSEGVGDNKKKQSVGTMAAKVAQYAVDKGLETVSAYNSGTYFVQGFVNGMNDWKTIAINTASNIAISALNALRAAGGEGSPWKTTTRSGRWFGKGFTNGIDEMTEEAERSAEQMSTRTIEALEKAQKKNIFDAYTPEQLDKAFDKLRAASNNITNRIVESAMVPSSKNLKTSRKESESNVFPRQIELIGGGKQTIILQLQNGQEIAHWLAPDISKELGIMR